MSLRFFFQLGIYGINFALIIAKGVLAMLLDKLLFSDRVPILLKKNLDFQSERNMLISSNISNVNTPGYKAQDIDFRSQLRSAMNVKGELSVKSTHGKHFGPSNNALKAVQGEVFKEPDAARSDGNNVDLDKEMAKLAENQIMYNATVQLMQKRGSTIRAAVTEIAQS